MELKPFPFGALYFKGKVRHFVRLLSGNQMKRLKLLSFCLLNIKLKSVHYLWGWRGWCKTGEAYPIIVWALGRDLCFLWFHTGDSRGRRHYVFGLSIHPSIYPVIVDMIFWAPDEGISSNLTQMSNCTHNELISFWWSWVKGQGHSDLICLILVNAISQKHNRISLLFCFFLRFDTNVHLDSTVTWLHFLIMIQQWRLL